MIPDLPAHLWAVVIISAALAGLAKTALPGAATIAVALCAMALPAKESTGLMLLMLMTGDLPAVWVYRKDADWLMLRRLVPAVVTGVVAGALFLQLASNESTRRVIGLILLTLIAVTLLRRRCSRREPGRRDPSGSAARVTARHADNRYTDAARPPGAADPQPRGAPPDPGSSAGSRLERLVYGSLAGFTTMVANAGGPVTSMYFLACRYPVKAFLGTTAWFFFAVNVVKLPFSISIGLVNPATLTLAAICAPVVVGVALLGRRLAECMDQRVFEPIVIALTVISTLPLLR